MKSISGSILDMYSTWDDHAAECADKDFDIAHATDKFRQTLLRRPPNIIADCKHA